MVFSKYGQEKPLNTNLYAGKVYEINEFYNIVEWFLKKINAHNRL